MTNTKFDIKNPVHFLALGFGSGLIKPAPGTWGTLAGIPVFLVLVWLAGVGSLWYSTAVVISFFVGIYLCGKTASDIGVHDHGAIVWDEIVGLLITLAYFAPNTATVAIGFLLFRLFDIVKPWPIKALDKYVDGGLGIMIDDVVAGIFAWLGLYAIDHYVDLSSLVL